MCQHPRYAVKYLGEEKNSRLDNYILIALQWGYDGDDVELNGILPNGFLPQTIIDLIKKHTDQKFVIRLHPNMTSGSYKMRVKRIEKLFSELSNVTLDYCKDDNLINVIKNAKVVVSMFSTISFEAVALGKLAVVMCPTLLSGGKNEGMFDYLIKRDACKSIDMNDFKKLEQAIIKPKKITPLNLFHNSKNFETTLERMIK